MTQISLQQITSGYNLTKPNANTTALQNWINNVSIANSNGNNTMYQDFDMNSNDLLNVNVVNTNALVIAGTAVVPSNLGTFAPNSVGTIQLVDGAVTDSKIVSLTGSKASFQQSGPGATVRDLQSKARELMSVRDFGATGNGGTDDYAAFNQLVSNANHGPMFVPAGLYVIGSSITIPNDIKLDSGAVLYPSGASTVITLSGSIDAGDYQIFNKALGGTVVLNDLARVCSPAWFGLLPRNTAAINSLAFSDLMAALSVQDAGAHIKFPAGNINVNTLTCTYSNVTLEGHYSGTWLINNTTNQPAISLNNFNAFFNTIKGFRIGQAIGVTPSLGNCGIYIKAQNTTLQDCLCFNFPAKLYDGFIIDGALGMKFYNNNALSCLNNGWHIGGSSGDLFGWANYGNSNGNNGFYFDGMSGLYAQSLNGFGNTNSAFWFNNSGTPNGSGSINEFVYAFAWIGDTSGGSNYNILNLADSSFDSCWGSTQLSPSTNQFASGFNVSGSGCKDISFNGCHALTNNGNGYTLDQGATNITMHGCHARGNGLSGVSNGAGFFVGLGAAVTNITLLGCRARSSAGAGISLGAFASDYIIVNNCNNQGNTGGTLVNNATGTHNNIGIAGNL